MCKRKQFRISYLGYSFETNPLAWCHTYWDSTLRHRTMFSDDKPRSTYLVWYLVGKTSLGVNTNKDRHRLGCVFQSAQNIRFWQVNMKTQVLQKKKKCREHKKAFYKRRHTNCRETLKSIQSQELSEAKLHSEIIFFIVKAISIVRSIRNFSFSWRTLQVSRHPHVQLV